MKKIKLDKEEAELLKSIENGEWTQVEDIENEKNNLKMSFENDTKIVKKINIEISERDFVFLKRKELETGIPYQITLQSIIHRYASDKLKINL